MAEHGAPLGIAGVFADAKRGELMVTQVGDAFGGFAQQHVDHMAGTKALPGAVDGGQGLLRQFGAIERARRVEAVVAIAAGL